MISRKIAGVLVAAVAAAGVWAASAVADDNPGVQGQSPLVAVSSSDPGAQGQQGSDEQEAALDISVASEDVQGEAVDTEADDVAGDDQATDESDSLSVLGGFDSSSSFDIGDDNSDD